MSQFSLPHSPTTKKTQFSSLLLSDIFLFFSFILSHPLYFSYFIFFSPYLIKILSFLSPLFVTTSLLLLALLSTLAPGLVHENPLHELSETKVSFLLDTYRKLTAGGLRSKADDEICFEELEAYKIVFEMSTLEITENAVEVLEVESEESSPATHEEPTYKSFSDDSFSTISSSETEIGGSDADQTEVTLSEIDQLIVEGKRLEDFLQEKKELESSTCEKEEKEVKLQDKGDEQKEELPMRRESKAIGNKVSEAKAIGNLQRLNASLGSTDTALGSNLGSFGSMRKEKEWRRTLACKLFEERHNVDGGSEGMDLLWETYETDSNKLLTKSNTKKEKKSRKNQSYEVDEDDDEEEDSDGRLCCLQALKFSAGKMNLGMGRPNLVKISKALKGIGWLHHVSRHGKKAYH